MKIEWNEHDFVSSTCGVRKRCERTHNLQRFLVSSSVMTLSSVVLVYCGPCIVVRIRNGREGGGGIGCWYECVVANVVRPTTRGPSNLESQKAAAS